MIEKIVRILKYYFLGTYFQQLSAQEYLRGRRTRTSDWPWPDADRRLVEVFSNESIPLKKRYDFLFTYFLSGFLFYRTDDCAHAVYPGAPGRYGIRVDTMEGFTRILPLISSWLSSGRENVIEKLDGHFVDLLDIVKTGVISGTNPKSSGFWGRMGDYDQRIHEAADVALSIWLTRDLVWCKLSRSQKERIIWWLLDVNHKKIMDNSWHLTLVLVNEIVSSLGYRSDRDAVHRHYERFKSFYKGNGWFSDGAGDVYDYYNAWSIHYALFWLDTINPEFDHANIIKNLRDFVRYYQYFFSPTGIPITGRSICYRMAAPAPLIAAYLKDPTTISAGFARRALDCTWRHFVSKGAVTKGNVSQGYWKEDLRFLDNYSGPASCLCSLRSLVLTFYCPADSDFWNAPAERLPIERTDYEITIPKIGWKIRGYKDSQDIQIIIMKNDTGTCYGVQDYNIVCKILELLTAKPFRPKNTFVKYKLYKYSSLNPFVNMSKNDDC